MGLMDVLLEVPRSLSGTFAHLAGGGTSPPTSLTEVAPVAWAIVLALALVTLASHWRRAVGSIPIPSGTPILPGGLPLLGHCIPALRNFHRLHSWLLECTQAMGEGTTFAFSLPLLPTSYMVTDPVCLEYVLKKRSDNFTKGKQFYTNFGVILGHGIFTADGPSWYWQRKLATNIFSVKSFKTYISTVFDEKMGLLSALVASAAASGAPIDLHDLMYRFTLDSFGQIGFGVDPGCLRSEGRVPFAAAFDSAQVIVNERFWLPAWPLMELLRGDTWRLRRDVATIRSFAANIVNQRRRTQLAADAPTAAAAGPGAGAAAHGDSNRSGSGVVEDREGEEEEGEEARPRDLLSLFMESEGPDGRPLTDQQLIDTVINFIIAGRDTTAQALSWTFHLLMQHPAVEDRLLQEIRDVLGHPAAPAGAAAAGGNDNNNTSGSGSKFVVERPSYEELRQLRYARAVFLEALRLYPSVPENAKYPTERDTLPDGTVVPPGAQVIYSPFVVNRLTKFWGPDAAAFRPERWLDDLQGKAPTPYQYLSFNAGPRLCLGQRLAELEGMFVLTSLLARFRFRRVGPEPEYLVSTTLPMKQGLRVVVEPRGA